MASDPPGRDPSTPDDDSAQRDEQPAPASPVEAAATRGKRKPRGERCNALLLSFVTFFFIAFSVWVVSASDRYRQEYAQATEGWRVGSTRVVELTLVKDDASNLACASQHEIAGLRCGYGRDKREAAPAGPDDSRTLKPYNTVGNELLLGAGLWSSPALKGELPGSRFSVICNYNTPVGKTVTAGTFTECMLPR
jgi:hypothetical protein